MTQINISLPNDLIGRVRRHAEKNGKTFSGMVRVGLEKQLDKDSKLTEITNTSDIVNKAKESCPNCASPLRKAITNFEGIDTITKSCDACLWSE